MSRGKARGLRHYRCKACGKTFGALTGTALSGLHHKGRWLAFGVSLAAGETIREAPGAAGLRRARRIAGATASWRRFGKRRPGLPRSWRRTRPLFSRAGRGSGSWTASRAGAAARPHVVELCGLNAQAGLDVAQAGPIGEQSEGHTSVVIRAGERLDLAVSVVAGHAATETVPRQVIHDLREDQLAGIHRHPLLMTCWTGKACRTGATVSSRWPLEQDFSNEYQSVNRTNFENVGILV